MSTDTVLVVQATYDELRKALLAKIQSAQYAPEITPLITIKAADRVSHLVADAVARGATAHTLFGSWRSPASASVGDRPKEYVAEVPATVLETINPDMEIASQEAFGPIVCLVPVASTDEAIQRINACKYGLSSSIHTKSHYSALSLAKKLKVAATHINGATVHDESTHPHGGHGNSGWGRFGGHWGLLEFVHTKTIITNP
jgi:acyl-CoA reductase-like NAD-dependent aldehyde dehydrogenase